MKGKKKFTKYEVDSITKFIKQKVVSDRNGQKIIRNRIREIGFYFSDFSSRKNGYTVEDFQNLIENGLIEVVEDNYSNTPIVNTKMSVLTHSKSSFEPISNSETTILILGTLPGDKSIEIGEYYGHPRNKFWKIISTITNNNMPKNYEEKKALLLNKTIGIWDVAHKANRKGSLDSAIEKEEPNNLEDFIAKHKNLRTIAFNGKKSEELYNKYFERKFGLKYISLPSTSPANAGIDFDTLCKRWQQILTE